MTIPIKLQKIIIPSSIKNINSRKLLKLLVPGILLLLVACQSVPKKKVADQEKQQQRQEAPSRVASHGQNAVLDSLEDALRDESISKARRQLKKIKVPELNPQQLFRYRLALIDFYRVSGRQKQAENAIVESRFDFLEGVPFKEQINLFLLYAKLLEDKGDIRTALRMLILADERLPAKEGQENQKQILLLMEKFSVEKLLQEARLAPDLYMRGWYDLGILRHLDDRYGRANAQELWRQKYTKHPGNRYLKFIVSRQQESLKAVSDSPNKRSLTVSFLLPFTDETLGTISESIVGGYIDMAKKYGIRVNDLSLDTASGRKVADLYARAVDEESDIVIGPLRKEQVQDLYQSVKRFSVPTIVLNDTGNRYRKRGNFYILSSNFEKNVEFAANTAWDHQCRKVAIIAQNESILAERGMRTFAKKWTALGGNIETVEILTKDKKLTEWVSGILGVSKEELDANKEVFRRYLLKLTQLGVSQEDINLLLGSSKQGNPINVLPFPDRTFLVRWEELSTLKDEYYDRSPQWVENSLAEQLPKRLNSINAPAGKSSYTKEELKNLMLDFILESKDSYSRADIECIFMAMDSIHLAKVRPFISFYLANDIPLFSTFLAYDRSSRRSEYSDLEGITYGEFPGVLNRHKELTNDKVFVKRFYLSGRDALLLSQTLPRMSHNFDTNSKKSRKQQVGKFNYYVLGEAGLLYMENNQIYNIPREVTFASGWPRRQQRLSIFQ